MDWMFILGGFLCGVSFGWHGFKSPFLYIGLIGFLLITLSNHY